MIKAQNDNLKLATLIAPAALDADNTEIAVDLAGYNAATIAIHVGVGGITFTANNKVEFTLTDSDDDNTYAAVTQADVDGVTVATGGIVKSLVAAHAAASVTQFAYIGRKQYIKLLANFSGTHSSATPMSALCIKGLPKIGPAT